jgi:hypothetical protein
VYNSNQNNPCNDPPNKEVLEGSTIDGTEETDVVRVLFGTQGLFFF